MMDKAVKWWSRHIIGGVRPDPINGEDRLLIFPEAQANSVVEVSPKAYGYYNELVDIKDRMERLESLEEHYKNLLKDYLKDAERLVG